MARVASLKSSDEARIELGTHDSCLRASSRAGANGLFRKKLGPAVPRIGFAATKVWRREWKRAKGTVRGDRRCTVSDFCPAVVHRTGGVAGEGSGGRVEGAGVESDKWTGFNLRPINILVFSSRFPVLSARLPFRRSPDVFRFFSRVCYLCRARGNISPTVGLASPYFSIILCDPRELEYIEVSTITSCSRRRNYVTTGAVARQNGEQTLSRPRNITRTCYRARQLFIRRKHSGDAGHSEASYVYDRT